MSELPSPDTHCFDTDTDKDVWSYSKELEQSILRQQQAEIDRLTEKLAEVEAIKALQAEQESQLKKMKELFLAVTGQRDRLLQALGDLSFECFGGGIGTCQPSVKTYNDTFAVLDEIRKGIT